jgi:hypothetical protein
MKRPLDEDERKVIDGVLNSPAARALRVMMLRIRILSHARIEANPGTTTRVVRACRLYGGLIEVKEAR